ncbi:MAG: pyridoxal 5'-phosphate synthase glutaminase subunit PdxT [Acidimicrobiia bacterium]|nr:MAG: pyridoxal 5'-phosphate synthase glutaminase subunit PdxT [Acidimicrobiia bacterium]
MRVGILALQGDVREHRLALERLGAEVAEVRKPAELDEVDGLIIPGGESTTIGRLATLYGLIDPLRKHIRSGLPVYGTCAGMIFLASGVDGASQPQLEVLDATVRRNAWGRQNESFEASLDIDGLDEPFHAVFIRAPWIEQVGDGVEVLARWADHPVMVREGSMLASSFHPELTGDSRVHELFLTMIESGEVA